MEYPLDQADDSGDERPDETEVQNAHLRVPDVEPVGPEPTEKDPEHPRRYPTLVAGRPDRLLGATLRARLRVVSCPPSSTDIPDTRCPLLKNRDGVFPRQQHVRGSLHWDAVTNGGGAIRRCWA